MKTYNNTLPPLFQTWMELYDWLKEKDLVRNELIKFGYEAVTYRFNLTFVKVKAFDELVESRITRHDYLNLSSLVSHTSSGREIYLKLLEKLSKQI